MVNYIKKGVLVLGLALILSVMLFEVKDYLAILLIIMGYSLIIYGNFSGKKVLNKKKKREEVCQEIK